MTHGLSAWDWIPRMLGGKEPRITGHLQSFIYLIRSLLKPCIYLQIHIFCRNEGGARVLSRSPRATCDKAKSVFTRALSERFSQRAPAPNADGWGGGEEGGQARFHLVNISSLVSYQYWVRCLHVSHFTPSAPPLPGREMSNELPVGG